MDTLATLHDAAQPLLTRVDATLESLGAPPDHRVWPVLRRCALLPGDAVAEIAAWQPEPLRERSRLLLTHRDSCSSIDALLRSPSTWEGRAAATFSARLESVRTEHDTLATNAATLAGHLDELADWIAHARTRLAHTLAATISSAQSVALTAAPDLALPAAPKSFATTAPKCFATTAPTTAAGLAAPTPSGPLAALTTHLAAAPTLTALAVPTALATSAADIAAELLTEADRFWQGALEISAAWSARLDTTPSAPPAAFPPTPTTGADHFPTLRVDL